MLHGGYSQGDDLAKMVSRESKIYSQIPTQNWCHQSVVRVFVVRVTPAFFGVPAVFGGVVRLIHIANDTVLDIFTVI